jgi:hypothetical protein
LEVKIRISNTNWKPLDMRLGYTRSIVDHTFSQILAKRPY